MNEAPCSDPRCEYKYPHYHGAVYGPAGNSAPAIVAISEDPRAEVRDPDSGEVIFPAVKGPLRVIEGDKPPADHSLGDNCLAEGKQSALSEQEEPLNPLPPSTQGGETDGILCSPSSPPSGRPETLATTGKGEP